MKVHVMLENLILLVIYGIEVVKFIIGTKLVLKESDQKKWMYWIGAGIVIVYLWIAKENSDRLIIYLIVFAISFISIEKTVKDKLIKILLLAVLIVSLDETISGLTKAMVEALEKRIILENINVLLDSFWGLILILLLKSWNDQKDVFKNQNVSKNKIFLLVTFNGIILVFSVSALNYAKEFVGNMDFRIFAGILVSCAYLCMSLLCWLLVYLRSLNEFTKEQLEYQKTMNVYKSSYYQKLLKKEEETRRFRHDINNHFMYLSAMVNANDIEGTKRYLSKLNHQLKRIQRVLFSTGNDLFDVILNEKLQDISTDIKVVIRGKAVCQLKVDEMDLCTIFANLIDNAVEAVNKIQNSNRYIFISYTKGHSFLKITIENSIVKRINFNKYGLPKTSKANGKNHGIGLLNVKEIVQKYDGEFYLSSNDKEFIAEVILPIKNLPIPEFNDR